MDNGEKLIDKDSETKFFFNVVPCGIEDNELISYVYEGDNESDVQNRVNCIRHGPMPSSEVDEFIEWFGKTITGVMRSAARGMRTRLMIQRNGIHV